MNTDHHDILAEFCAANVRFLFFEPGIVFQMGLPPRLREGDIITKIDGVTFTEAWEEWVPVIIDGLSLFTLSHQHLLRNKEAAGRPKGLADADSLL